MRRVNGSGRRFPGRARRSVLGAAVLCLMSGSLAFTQGRGGAGGAAAADAATTNPVDGKPVSIENGSRIFLSRCTGCHGRDARGYLGPDLTGLWANGATDAQLFRTVQRGVPGTEMPPFDIRSQDLEIWEILAYLKSINAPVGAAPAPTGDAANGEKIFRANCSGCHIVGGRGGELGPNLSRIGSGRSRATLAEKIRGTSKVIRGGYEPVTLVTKDGEKIRGVKKNEDDWTIQIMDMRARLRGFLKQDLTQVTDEKQSVMPVYGPAQISDRDLDDLLRYLGTLRTESR